MDEKPSKPLSKAASLAAPSPSAQVYPHPFPLSSNLDFEIPPFTDIKQNFESEFPASDLTDNKRTFTSAFPSSELVMASELSARKRRGKANRSNPGFQGYGCYMPNCDFVSTGKNTLSGHLGTTHGLSQNEKELGKIELINRPEDSNPSTTTSNSTLRTANKGPGLSELSRTLVNAPTRTTSTPSYTQHRPDRPVTFSDPLPPWRAPEASTKSPRAKFDHTRLPVFYKCYFDECKVLGRTPESILKHWQADFEMESKMEGDNPTHCGHLWDIDLVYKFIRDKNGDVKVTTHGQSPELPGAEILDPKNVKQYFPPLSHTHVARIKLRSTAISSVASSPILDSNIWSCMLCDTPIGSLVATKEHIADCHGFMRMDHNAGTKKMHFLVAHADANGETECHVPEGGEECGYVGNGDILHHLVEAHDLLEDDLLDNESTGRIFLTLAEVK